MSAPTLEWRAIPSHIAEGAAEVRHKDGWLVCEVSSDRYASLIAAAPDLLAALKDVLDAAMGADAPRKAWDAARAAIAKAEGRS